MLSLLINVILLLAGIALFAICIREPLGALAIAGGLGGVVLIAIGLLSLSELPE